MFVVNPYLYSGAYLVDLYPSIFAAFSPLRLSSSTVYSVRVRRSSDGVEDDFSPEQVLNGALETWVGASNNGTIVRAYNQGTGGSLYEIFQGNSSLQPRIVVSGALVLLNGLPTFDYLSTQSMSNLEVIPEFQVGEDFSIIVGTAPKATGALFTIQNRPYSIYHDSRATPNRHVNINGIFFDLSIPYNNTNMRILSSSLSSSGTDRIDCFDNGNTGGAGTIGTYATPSNGIIFNVTGTGNQAYHSFWIGVNNVTDRAAIVDYMNGIYSVY